MKISKGSIIDIKNTHYEILSVTEGIDRYDTKKDKAVGEHTAISLHKLKDSSLHPTHLLKIYKDKEAFLFDIIPIKPPEWIKPRQRGHMSSYANKRKVLIKDIKTR